MTESNAQRTINIRPPISVYATYRRLSYKPWYAIAEFVDNSTQNYYDHKKKLLRAYKKEGNSVKLRVDISYDSGDNTLTFTDNANGMNFEELTRAVVLDKPPPDTTGRCEFGMGLKTAACWFGSSWTIHTSRLGSDKEFRARVHVPDLIEDQTEDIQVEELFASPESHFTIIKLQGLYNPIRGRTPSRIRDQLGSMYREDLRHDEIEIIWNGQPISFQEPPFLTEDIGGHETTWYKDIFFEVPIGDELIGVPEDSEGQSLEVHGWVGIRNPGRQQDCGFALLRRNRVIIGGPGGGYKPVEIFGQGNTFRSQRLVGELHMEQWGVTQAKDTFDWTGGLEDKFIEELKKVCRDYMDKCEGFRERDRPITHAEMELASERMQKVLEDERFGIAVTQEVTLPDPPKTEEQEQADAVKLHEVSDGPILYRLTVGGEAWVFRLHWQDQLSDAHWMSVSYPQDDEIDIFLNMAHPFFAPHLENRGFLELLQKFVISMALAERMAREVSGNERVEPGDFRNYMNRVLRHVSEIEAEYGP